MWARPSMTTVCKAFVTSVVSLWKFWGPANGSERLGGVAMGINGYGPWALLLDYTTRKRRSSSSERRLEARPASLRDAVQPPRLIGTRPLPAT